VEGSAPSKMEKEIVHRVGARNMAALTTWSSFAPPFGKKKKNFGWWLYTWIYCHLGRVILMGGNGSGWRMNTVGKNRETRIKVRRHKPRSRKGRNGDNR
jgi:hypothetical protein